MPARLVSRGAGNCAVRRYGFGGDGSIASACGAAVLFAVGAVATFGDAIFTNGFGVRLPPGVGTQRGVVGFTGQKTIQHVLEVGPDIQVVADGTADQG